MLLSYSARRGDKMLGKEESGKKQSSYCQTKLLSGESGNVKVAKSNYYCHSLLF